MLILRLIAGFLFLCAAIALGADVTRMLNSKGAFVATSLAQHWKDLSPQMLTAMQQGVTRNLHPLVWDPIIWRLLLLPAWFLFGALGLLFAHLGRRQRRVNIFIN